jgi:phospholipase C
MAKATSTRPIDHVVIIVKENHGFDNYFGTFPGVNGDHNLAHAPNPPTADPNHTHEGWLTRATTAARLQYLESDIPMYFSYAREFTLCDNYFTAVAGPSTPNHLMLITADSPVIANPPTYRGHPQVTYNLPSLPDLLDRASLTWAAYTTGYPFNLITNLGTRNQKHQSAFIADAQAGKLPNVTWIYGGQGYDEHPLANVTTGMNWTAQLVDAVAHGPLWSRCAIFITWDDWGGWYDHVDPPALEQWTDGSQFYPGGRVGCLVLSPYAKRGYISRAQHTHVSLIKFCEVLFNLPNLNARDAASDGMEDCFDFAAPPNLTPPQGATTTPTPAKPGRKRKKSPTRKKTPTRKKRPARKKTATRKKATRKKKR